MSEKETTNAAGGGEAVPLNLAHAISLEQCSIFVDSVPLKRSMTDAAAYLRTLAAPTAKGGTERPEFSENDLRDLSERKGWYRREGTSVPTLDGWYHPFTVTADGRALCDFINEFAASPPPPAGAAGGGSGDMGALSAGYSQSIHYREGKWYFWAEDWATEYGPYPDEWAAARALIAYADQNLAPTPDLGAQGEPVADKQFSRQDWFKCEFAAAELRRAGHDQSADAVLKAAMIADEAPAAPRTGSGVSVDRIGFEAAPLDLPSQVAAAVMGLGWSIPEPTGDDEADAEEQCRRYGTIQEAVLTLFAQAPRDGGETQIDQSASEIHRYAVEAVYSVIDRAMWEENWSTAHPGHIALRQLKTLALQATTLPSGVETIRQDNTSGGKANA